jgi:hypothetical protein
MLSEKHYVVIAKILRDSGNSKRELINQLCDYFETDDPLFDRTRFKMAIDGEKFHNYKFINNDTVDLLNIDVLTFNGIGSINE